MSEVLGTRYLITYMIRLAREKVQSLYYAYSLQITMPDTIYMIENSCTTTYVDYWSRPIPNATA